MKLILINPAMCGRMVFKGQGGEPIVNEGAYPAILTSEEWDNLQQRLAIRREGLHRGQTSISTFLLSGILRCAHCGGAMTGASRGLQKYTYYVCSNHKKAQALCDQQKSHPRAALEEAILAHLGQYSDPDVVRQLLAAQGQETDARDEAELARVNSRLAVLEQGFLNDLDRVDRKDMTEPEYVKRQEVRREEQGRLQPRKVELEASVAAQRDMEAQAEAVPVKVRSFLEDFQEMEVRQAKAILQGIIKAAHVSNDGRIELEFR